MKRNARINMGNKRYQLFSTFLIILCINSLFYNQILETDLGSNNTNSEISANNTEITDTSEYSDLGEKTENDVLVPKSETLGDFQTFAFFPSGTGYIYGPSRIGESLITDPSGEDPYGRRNVVEWVPYDDIKDDGTLNKEFYWRACSSYPDTWPNNTDWFYLREQGYPNEPSKIYSPVFTEDYEISGKVHWWSYLQVNNTAVFSEAVTIGYRVQLYLFNPANLSSIVIASRTQTYPINMWNGYRTFSDTLENPITIPAGYRLRWDILVRFSSVPTTGSFLQYTGYPWGGVPSSTTWTINDGPIYSNSYTINNASRMTGIQLYMRSKKTPDINLFGATNNTVYQTAQEMTIDVTDGSTSSYKWDSGSWIPFDNQTTINLPSAHGWHDLRIEAIDPVFGNTRLDYYQIGYDASTNNLILEAPVNGSTIGGGTKLDFAAYYVDTVEYMWDNNGTWYPLTSPYDIDLEVYGLIGEHNITLRTTDFYTTETFFYLFTFDSIYPTVILYNVVNESTYAPGKIIEVEIYDDFGIQSVIYHWDSDGNTSWLPTQGNIYQTSLPEVGGTHFLYVSAYDTYNHITNKTYQFYTDSSVFLVELAELRNSSYYLGGEEVIINVQRSNGTIRYVWDSGVIKDGSIIGGQLSLTGTDVLPLVPGFHNLTVITFDITNFMHIFFFNFTVDQTAPIIDNSILAYNNDRFKTNTILLFTITDNYISSEDLIVLISINEKANETLNHPYQLNLITFEDGVYEFYLFVFDIAGNYDVKFITFVVDTTKPDIDVTIPDMVDFTLVDGNIYIPSDALIQISIDDEDPSVFSYYSWNSSTPMTPFTDDFILSQPDSTALLYIYVNDSLGNFKPYSITLTIDSIAPVISLSSFPENTIVNGFTPFGFNVEEEYPDTVTYVKYYWDALAFWWNNAPTTNFVINLLPNANEFYDHNDTATVVIETSDVLGNNATYNFNFITDFEVPLIKLYLNESGLLTELLDGVTYTVTGNTPIWYNSSINQDLGDFRYQWDLDEMDTLFDPWIFLVKSIDGLHELRVDLFDNTVSDAANKASAIYYIIVDDINIQFNETEGIEWVDNTYSIRMNYSETFNFYLNVTDAVNGTEILDLNTRSTQELYNFQVNFIKLADNITYYCEIAATNITYNIETFVEFEFYTLTGGSQSVTVYLIVDKRTGELSIQENTELTVYYGDNVEVFVNLKDHLGDNTSIILLEVNSIVTEFSNVAGTSTYWFNYTTYGLPKGSHSFDIYVESIYHYAVVDGNFSFEFEVLPLPLFLDIQVSNFTVIEGTQLAIIGTLTYENGTGVPLQLIHFYIYSFSSEVNLKTQAAIPTNYTSYVILNKTANFTGSATVLFSMTADIDYVMIFATFDGDNFRAPTSLELEKRVIRVVPPGIPSWMLYLIIGGSILAIALIALIVYKVTRPKEFEELMSKLADEDIALSFSIMSPGVVLTIFDQRKGPTPLLEAHSLSIARYKNRMQIDVENFLLKIADQAYSSLGFEEHDAGRRTGSIVLPREKMIGFIHGIQLPNEAARGGFENLSLIVLADSDFGNLLLNYQEFLYDEVDDLIKDLKAKKELPEIREKLEIVRKKSVMIMLAAKELEESTPE